MMTQIAKKEVKLPEGFTVDPSLDEKYDKEPYFLDKAEKARQILEKYPIPEHLLHHKSK